MQQIINGVWQIPDRLDAHAVKAKSTEVDDLVRALGEIVVAASRMSDADHARVRSFVLAAGDLMMSRGRLKPDDRQLFESALRNVVQRHG